MSATAACSSIQTKLKKVKQIFDRYLELGTVRELQSGTSPREESVLRPRYRKPGTPEAGNHSHAVRFTICSRAQSTLETFGTRRNATPGYTRP